MSASIHQFVVDELQAAKGQWRVISEGAGVSRRTLQKIARMESGDPRISQIDKLVSYLGVEKLTSYLNGKARRRSS